MAKQKGVFRVQGSMSGATFFRRKISGFFVQDQMGMDPQRIKNDPAFARTRKNACEFATAAKGGKLLRRSLKNVIRLVTHTSLITNLFRVLIKVLHKDTTNPRGERTIQDGDMLLLKGFDINTSSVLSEAFGGSYDVTVDRVAGTITVDVGAFVPATDVKAPANATHVKVITSGAQVDFAGTAYVSDLQQSAYIPINTSTVAAQSLVNQVDANTTLPLFTLFGILFYEEVNGIKYPLQSGTYNALELVDVNVS